MKFSGVHSGFYENNEVFESKSTLLLVLQVFWSTSTSHYRSCSTFTMMYSTVLVHLSTGPVVFNGIQNCCTVLTCTLSTPEY
jgi:hypothetical protein